MKNSHKQLGVETLEPRQLLAALSAVEVTSDESGLAVVVSFESAVNPSTLEPSDLIIDGESSAASATLVNPFVAVFELEGLDDGPHVVSMVDEAIRDTTKEPFEGFDYPFTLGSPAEFEINHPPRLQLGNAPLNGFEGSDFDQVEILWQTVPSTSGGNADSFEVEMRLADQEGPWRSATSLSQIDTGVDGRVVHANSILDLNWRTQYEYRVRHLRGGVNVATYQHEFKTRQRAGDSTSFSFVAYGDAAEDSGNGKPEGFQAVQARINQTDAEFAVLLGDNVYRQGTHENLDLRFDPHKNPEAAEWTAGHIDYLGFGNHDIAFEHGKATEENYSVPIPVAGENAHAAPPMKDRSDDTFPWEMREHNFSWDYGDVHFVTIDTSAFLHRFALDDLLDYVVADLNASNARWKIVYGHHPFAGTPDKPEGADDNYYQQVVERLYGAGADLFMVGHSHTYSWTYPLTGQFNHQATFVESDPRAFREGDGLIQLVSGLGGKEARGGSYEPFPFVAAGFTVETKPASRIGFTQVDVENDQLTLSYIAADDGEVIDAFTISGNGLDARIAEPQDNGPDDLDLRFDAVTSNLPRADMQVQLTHHGNLDPDSVTAETISLSVDGHPLENGTDFNFSYDIENSRISLTPVTSSFEMGTYEIVINDGTAKIADQIGRPLAKSTLLINVVQSQTFQQGVDDYASAVDTVLLEQDPDRDHSKAIVLQVNNTAAKRTQSLIRFDDVFGDGVNQIPTRSTIVSARLEFDVPDRGSPIQLHRMLQPWQDSDSWNTFAAGIQTDGVEADETPLATMIVDHERSVSIDITGSLLESKHGWVVLPTGDNNVEFDSTESEKAPRLVVDFVPPMADLVTASIAAQPNHIQNGQTELQFTVANEGFGMARNFLVEVVLSDDEIIGNEDDQVVNALTIPKLAAGDSRSEKLPLQLPQDVLYRWALRDDPPRLELPHTSSSFDFIGLVIDPDSRVAEINEENNRNVAGGHDKTMVNYFPWDVSPIDGRVTASDADFITSRLGTSDEHADLDGNGLVTPTDAVSLINRLDYQLVNGVPVLADAHDDEPISDSTEESTSVELTLQLVERDLVPGLIPDENFEVHVRFTDVRNPEELTGVFSGFADIQFSPDLIRVNSIEYAEAFSHLRSGLIDVGMVSNVGAVVNRLEPHNNTTVAILHATALSPGSTTIQASAVENDLSQVVVFGNDNDQRDRLSSESLGVTIRSRKMMLDIFRHGRAWRDAFHAAISNPFRFRHALDGDHRQKMSPRIERNSMAFARETVDHKSTLMFVHKDRQSASDILRVRLDSESRITRLEWGL